MNPVINKDVNIAIIVHGYIDGVADFADGPLEHIISVCFEFLYSIIAMVRDIYLGVAVYCDAARIVELPVSVALVA